MRCITLLSDLGLQDASVASVKGILLQHLPQIPVIDISHLAQPYHLHQAAYLLAAAYRNFPENTCHLLLAGIFSVKEPRMVLCRYENHYFLAPDNGLLYLAFRKEPEAVWECHTAGENERFTDWVKKAAGIISGLQAADPSEMGFPEGKLLHIPVPWLPKTDGNSVECHVIYIDHFENVVVNITKEQFEEIAQGRSFTIRFMRDELINKLSNRYTDVKKHDKLCRFNSAGYLEIAINQAPAASLFGLRLHQEHHVMYNTIKIFFE